MATMYRKAAVVLLTLLLSAGYVLVAVPVAASPGPEEVSPHDDIIIASDEEFDAAHGVRSGSGTKADPYVISGWKVRNLFIRDTAKHVLIQNNEITSRLTLNWNGPGVTVVDNRIRDLRVNQNVKRTGAATGGLIANNQFGTVGQLRHFDGIFENNVVKPPRGMFDMLWDIEAVQFDGFHGSRFRNNTLYGYLDVKLHGHHHGSGFAAPSHYHGSHHEGSHEDHDDMPDHTKRFHEVWVTNNTIYSPGPYALRYTDTNHRGDDRTAASEQNKELEKPHIHQTRIHLIGNQLIGSGLFVDIFNANDQNHTGTKHGLMEIRNNNITLERVEGEVFESRPGIQVRSAKDLMLVIDNNVVAGETADDDDLLDSSPWTKDAGIYLQDLDLAHVQISNNEVSHLAYGVRASRFTGSVHWWVTALKTTSVGEDVYYDDSVSNPPEDGP